MCASTTWTKIATTTSCGTCSTSVQRARARRVDVGLTQASWSLQFEHAAPVAAMISLGILFHTLHAILWLPWPTWPRTEKPFWLARIQALRYNLLTLPHTIIVRGRLLVGGVVLDQPASSATDYKFSMSNWGDQSTISAYAMLRWLKTGHSRWVTEYFAGYAQWSGVRRARRFYSDKDRNLLDSVLACSFASTVPDALDGRMTRHGFCMLLLSYQFDGNIALSVYCVFPNPKCESFN